MNTHRLREEQSLALHRRIAERLHQDPRLIDSAKARLDEWSRNGTLDHRYVSSWRAILEQPIDEICRVLVDPGEKARALRQTTPFAGVLSPDERRLIRSSVGQLFGQP